MSVLQQVDTLRTSVALTDAEHVSYIRVSGDDAFDVLDRLCPRELYVRDGQMLHSLFLREDGRPFADVYVCRDDDDFIVLAEGPAPDVLLDWMRDGVPSGAGVELEDLTAGHRILSLNGPYAWEMLAELAGPDVVGLPYLNFYYEEGWTCFRAGKTGEYGYDLVVPAQEADALAARIQDQGARFDLGTASLEALDHCALENWFFDIRCPGVAALTPLELQLQWRVSYRKDYVGAAALKQRREAGIRQRLTCVAGPASLARGASVSLEGRHFGEILAGARSDIRGEWIGLALLDIQWALPGVSGLTVAGDSDVPETSVRTVCPPLVNNRSLHVNPQRHSFFSRHDTEFPPLVQEEA